MEANIIKNLDPKEKIILMNTIWESLDDHHDEIKSPEWHRGIVEKRVQNMKDGISKTITIDTLKNR